PRRTPPHRGWPRDGPLRSERCGAASRSPSMTSPSAEHRKRGPGQDAHVLEEADTSQILDVDLGAFVHRLAVLIRNLPQPRQARLHEMTLVLPLLIVGDDVWHLRSRADQTHVTLDDVPELGQLVEP